MPAKISRKQLYVAAKTIDNNSHVAADAKLRSYDPDFSDESVAEFVGATTPQIRRLRLDIFGPFAEVKKQTAKERIAQLEAQLAAERAARVGGSPTPPPVDPAPHMENPVVSDAPPDPAVLTA